MSAERDKPKLNVWQIL